ncbi:hypothetical protein BDW22DRAFT_1428250 [Trametopsis cervina]|nr:hypothetical protein BDW22DRAFT_1428250 [Trametopsis cervina]
MQTIVVDDTDSSLLYTGQWLRGGNPPEHDSTTHGTSSEGSIVIFPFHGTSVQVIGTIGSTGTDGTPTTSYSLDDNPATPYTAPKNPGSTLYNQTFFTSPTLPDGGHSLKVTLLSNNSYFWLDYLLVNQNAVSSTAFSTTQLASFSTLTPIIGTLTSQGTGNIAESIQVNPLIVSSSTAATTATEGPVDTSVSVPVTVASSTSMPSYTTATKPIEGATNTTQSPSDQITGSRPHQPAALAGIILGTLGILAVAVAVAWWCIRRHRARQQTTVDSYHSIYTDSQPYLLPAQMQMTDYERASYADTAQSNNFNSRPSILAMSNSAPSRSTTVTKSVGPHQDEGLHGSPAAQRLDGLTDRSFNPDDTPPTYSSLGENS